MQSNKSAGAGRIWLSTRDLPRINIPRLAPTDLLNSEVKMGFFKRRHRRVSVGRPQGVHLLSPAARQCGRKRCPALTTRAPYGVPDNSDAKSRSLGASTSRERAFKRTAERHKMSDILTDHESSETYACGQMSTRRPCTRPQPGRPRTPSGTWSGRPSVQSATSRRGG